MFTDNDDEYVWVVYEPDDIEIYFTREDVLDWVRIQYEFKNEPYKHRTEDDLIEEWSIVNWAFFVKWEIYKDIMLDRTKLNYQQWRESCKQQ